MCLTEYDKGLYRSMGRAESLAEGKAIGREEGKAIGREEGKAEGLAEGKEKGRTEGLAEGRAIGRAEERISLLSSLVHDGTLSLEKAAEKAGLSVEEFKKQMNQQSAS